MSEDVFVEYKNGRTHRLVQVSGTDAGYKVTIHQEREDVEGRPYWNKVYECQPSDFLSHTIGSLVAIIAKMREEQED